MLDKIVLGTAQLSPNYGITKSTKKITFREFKKISNFCLKNNISYIDTAINYKNSDKYLSLINKNKFKIITKIPYLNIKKKSDIISIVDQEISKILSSLKVNKFHALLLHSPHQLNSRNGKYFYSYLEKLKQKGIFKKLGISVYTKAQTIKIIKKYKIDILQFPYNLINRAFDKKNFLNDLKKKKIELHARSCFLQGVLLNKPKLKKLFFLNNLKEYFKWIENESLTPLEACLNFVYKNKYIDKFVLGFDNSMQIKDLKNIDFKKKINFPKKFYIKNKNIIDPRKW